MFYGRLTNRQRTDNDPSFQVSVTGYSRGEWSLVMQALAEWETATEHQPHAEQAVAVKNVYRALQAHVVENSDGYQVQAQAHQLTERESACLTGVRERQAKELQDMEELAKQIKAAQRKLKRKAATSGT